jgi:nanoRNase/pAp phosphatase (c-di-AMP/oligoRNAs hydrolase)
MNPAECGKVLVKQEELFFHAYDNKLRFQGDYKKNTESFLVNVDASGKRLLENIESCLGLEKQDSL